MNKNQKSQKFIRGISIIEILVVIFIVSLTLTALLGLANFSLRISNLTKETIKANHLAQEAIEAVRNFRDKTKWEADGLGTLSTGDAYSPQKLTDRWQLVQGEETIDIFTRKIIFNDVFRDGNDNIVETGGTIDPQTKKATVIVSWRGKEVKLVTYLTNFRQ